jgi:hypothetical protein
MTRNNADFQMGRDMQAKFDEDSAPEWFTRGLTSEDMDEAEADQRDRGTESNEPIEKTLKNTKPPF